MTNHPPSKAAWITFKGSEHPAWVQEAGDDIRSAGDAGKWIPVSKLGEPFPARSTCRRRRRAGRPKGSGRKGRVSVTLRILPAARDYLQTEAEALGLNMGQVVERALPQ